MAVKLDNQGSKGYLLGCPVEGESSDVSGDQIDVTSRHRDEPGVSVNQSLVDLVGAIKLVPECRHACKDLGDSLVEWLHNLQQAPTFSNAELCEGKEAPDFECLQFWMPAIEACALCRVHRPQDC